MIDTSVCFNSAIEFFHANNRLSFVKILFEKMIVEMNVFPNKNLYTCSDERVKFKDKIDTLISNDY